MKFSFNDDFPNELNLPSNKTTFSISILFVLIGYGISIFGLNNLNILIKIIICLSVTSFVLFIDLIILFVRERELYYFSCWLKQYYDETNRRLQSAEQELININSRLDALNHK